MKISNNTALPELPAWQARSFWVQVLLVLSVVLNAQGIDLYAWTCATVSACTADEVLAKGEGTVALIQQLSPIALGLWAWIERRAPNYRLILWPKAVQVDLVGMWLALAFGLAVAAVPGRAAAQAGLQCAGHADVLAGLARNFSERIVWSGLAGTGQMLVIVANPDGDTWTALIARPDGQTCLLTSGEGWLPGDAPDAPGEAG